MADRLYARERAVLHHHKTSQFFDFQDGGRLPSWIFEIETSNTMHVLHHHAKFCEGNSQSLGKHCQKTLRGW